MSKTVPALNAVLALMGSDVTYHREEGNVPCPCVTPEGFRDPAFHNWLAAFDFVDHGITVDLEPGSIDKTQRVDWYLMARNDAGGDAAPIIPLGSVLPNTQPTNYRVTFGNIPWPPSGSTSRYGVIRQAGNGPFKVLGDISFPSTSYTDNVLVGTEAGSLPEVYPVICNEEGILPSIVTNAGVKAIVQPATIGQRGRAAERASALLGEVQRDDHFGIFPCEWDATTLDMTAFIDNDSNFVLYDSRRFFVVAADKIPDIDGDPNHHWEVGLRLVKNARPVA